MSVRLVSLVLKDCKIYSIVAMELVDLVLNTDYELFTVDILRPSQEEPVEFVLRQVLELVAENRSEEAKLSSTQLDDTQTVAKIFL